MSRQPGVNNPLRQEEQMKRSIFSTDKAPGAIGAYSQAVIAGDMIYTSGQIPINPATGVLVKDSVESEARQVLENIKCILEAAGSSMDNVIKMTVYLADLKDFDAVNRIYAGYFKKDPPARSCIQAAALPKGASVEMDAAALL